MDYNTLYQGDSFAVAGDSYLMAKVPQSCCAAAVDQVICLTMFSFLCVSHIRTCAWSLLLLQMVLLSRAALLWCRVRLSIMSMCSVVSALQSLLSWSASFYCFADNCELFFVGVESVYLLLHVLLWVGQRPGGQA